MNAILNNTTLEDIKVLTRLLSSTDIKIELIEDDYDKVIHAMNSNDELLLITKFEKLDIDQKEYIKHNFENRYIDYSIDDTFPEEFKRKFLTNSNNSSDSVQEEYVLIKTNSKLLRVKISEIQYIKSEGKYAMLYTLEKHYASKVTLKEILQYLPSSFIRCHMSYIINISHIDYINIKSNTIKLSDKEVPYSRAYRNEILDRFTFL